MYASDYYCILTGPVRGAQGKVTVVLLSIVKFIFDIMFTLHTVCYTNGELFSHIFYTECLSVIYFIPV